MVYDGAVKDQESSAGPTPSAAVSEASSASASEAVVSATPARPAHDKRLGVRHPLKHRRFRAGGKMMVEPGGVSSARAVAEGEEEEEASEVEEEDEEETTSAETEMPSADGEVSSALAPVVSVVEDMEVEGGEMERSPEAAIELEAWPDKEEEEVSSLVAAQGERKQEATPAASVPASEPPNDKDEDKEREEKERQKERERVDEVGYMSGGWKRYTCCPMPYFAAYVSERPALLARS